MQKGLFLFVLFLAQTITAQDYFYKKYHPFNEQIPTPEAYLGYEIGAHHTRHDRIVGYLELLADKSDRAQLTEYGKTHEGRKLVILTVSSATNLGKLDAIREQHLEYTDPAKNISIDPELPAIINLGYNVHGNEPSSSEAALLSAYTLVASESPEIAGYRRSAVIHIDPTINPDGRDRHTHWANMYQGNPLVTDPQDAEHNEYWPMGRTNHYWFDLNRDWLLAINPESRGKLNWYHQWYPNVVTDFHEMGSNSTYFFEPMKDNGSLNPIMPKENYVDLNNLFGEYYAKALDSIGSLYFTKEVFDGTYPGYGSSYPDLQGGLGLLFEQASSRGHAQKTAMGKLTFPFTIRNQFLSSMTTVRAACENKDRLREYQHNFFKSAISRAEGSRVKGYTFDAPADLNRLKAFVDKLLIHRIEVYQRPEGGLLVPAKQPQYRMVQTVFETYDKYRDSVYYDASAWSLANFYNIKYRPVTRIAKGARVGAIDELGSPPALKKSEYAYIIDGNDYNTFAAIYYLLKNKLKITAAFKPFSATLEDTSKNFNYGSIVIPVKVQDIDADKVFEHISAVRKDFQVPVYGVGTGYSSGGVDLGSRYMRPITMPKAAMFIGQGVRSYEAGEIWHLLDTRVGMPISKLPLRNFNRIKLEEYNTLVMVSGNYDLTEKQQEKITDWVKRGNTLITIGTASKWVVEKKWVKEKLIEEEKDSTKAVTRLPYVEAGEHLGREQVGGIILKADIDKTHPLAFGYTDTSIPVYKNNRVWLAPSTNPYATVAKYAKDFHIDGYISEKTRTDFIPKSASSIVSELGSGRIVLFADNPNFRGSWYGTNRLFLNALFLGDKIANPD